MNHLTSRIEEIPHGTPEYRATVALRQQWLRHPLGLRFTDEELAAEADSHHLACYLGETMVGCVVLRPIDRRMVRMRQLAVRKDFERQGLGRALVEQSEVLARQLGYARIFLHARLPVVGFYERLGYQKKGETFIEVTIPHQEMVKDLSAS